MRSAAGVVLLLLALVACGSAPTHVAATDKAQAKQRAAQQVVEAEAFSLDAQRAIDQAAAAVAEAERVIAEQRSTTTRPQRASRARSAPTPRVTAAPAPVGNIQEAICNAFGRACAWALRVAKCESGFNPRATNGQFRGLFQIGVKYHAARTQRMGYTLDQLWEPGPNIAVALAIYHEQGGSPWQCK